MLVSILRVSLIVIEKQKINWKNWLNLTIDDMKPRFPGK
jgi:hypothetical protein